MTAHHELQYSRTRGTFELVGAILGAMVGYSLSGEITSFLQNTVNSTGFTELLNKEPVIAKTICIVCGLFCGFTTGKTAGKIVTHFRRIKDDKRTRQEFEEKSDWIRQNQKRKSQNQR